MDEQNETGRQKDTNTQGQVNNSTGLTCRLEAYAASCPDKLQAACMKALVSC